MKAIQLIKYGSADKAFRSAEVSKPKLQSEDDVLVKVHAFGLNFADVMARKGLYRAAPPIPAVLGYEVIGEVVEVKSTNHQSLIGKRVVALTRFGGYAEYACTKISGLVEVPNQINDGEALALATQYCTAFLAVKKCQELKEKDAVLIHSATGGVGTAITQLLKHKGCKVIGLTRSNEKVDYLIKNGVDIPIVTTKGDYSKQILEAINNHKVAASFNSVGGKTIKKDLSLLATNGQLVFFGISDRTNQKRGMLFTLFQLLKIGKTHPAKLLLNSQAIHGLNLLALADNKSEQIKEALQELISLRLEKKILPKADFSFEWENIAKAHDGLEKGKFTGKVFIKVV